MQSADTIGIKEMMDYIKTSKPFAIRYTTWNEQTGRGGDEKFILNAQRLFGEDVKENEGIRNNINNLVAATKNPNHFANSTFNIRVVAAGRGDIRKVHVQLVTEFNGKTVL
jgi:hypothetical protein